jgi:hypothetical protein
MMTAFDLGQAKTSEKKVETTFKDRKENGKEACSCQASQKSYFPSKPVYLYRRS